MHVGETGGTTPPYFIIIACIECGAGSISRSGVRPSVRLCVCPVIRPQQRRAAGLLLSAVRVGDIDRQRRAASSSGAAARRSAANAGSVTLTAETTRLRLNTDLLGAV